jgi:ribosomal protein S18 acetylase RimI-like enzyme
MDIALLPAYRRRGIGTRLLEKVLSEGARSEKTVSIHVEAFNPALRWYERLGFKKVADHGPYYLMTWTAGAANHRSEAGPEVETQHE